MKGFIDELPACIKSLEGTTFSTTDLALILAGGCNTIYFKQTFFFFFTKILEIKICLNTDKSECHITYLSATPGNQEL